MDEESLNPRRVDDDVDGDIFKCNPTVSEVTPCPKSQTCNYVNWSVGHQMQSCTAGCPPAYILDGLT